jgi:hypothetical protein
VLRHENGQKEFNREDRREIAERAKQILPITVQTAQ